MALLEPFGGTSKAPRIHSVFQSAENLVIDLMILFDAAP